MPGRRLRRFLTTSARQSGTNKIFNQGCIMIFNADTEYVKVLGRTYYRDNIRWCAFSASGVEFAAKSDSLSVEIFGDDRAGDPENAPRIGIFVNGERVIDKMIEKKRTVFLIAHDTWLRHPPSLHSHSHRSLQPANCGFQTQFQSRPQF